MRFHLCTKAKIQKSRMKPVSPKHNLNQVHRLNSDKKIHEVITDPETSFSQKN